MQDHLRGWLSNPTGLAKGDPSAIQALFVGLVSAGIAMEVYGSSRPASGADHQVAHLWEMDNLAHAGKPVSHGVCVALGTLTILSLYEWVLAQDFRCLDIDQTVQRRRRLPELEADIRRRFPIPSVAERTLQETRAKYIEDAQLRSRLIHITHIWPDLQRRLSDFLIPFNEMKATFEHAGVVTDPMAVGIDRGYHRETLVASRFIRRRYTLLDFLEDTGCFDEALLDFLEDTGCFDEAVQHIFSDSGRWG